MNFSILLFLAFLTIWTSCNGQNASFTAARNANSTVGDTVSELSKSILIVFQASDGTYWFGSDENGLYSFDGTTIIHFSAKDGLSNNRIRSIQEDRYGNIYVATLGGINKFDGHVFTTLTAISSKSPTDNWKLQSDDLWFSMPGKNGEKGPYRYDGKHLYQLEFPKHYMADEYFARFPDNAWSPYEVYYICKDSKGMMWFGTSNFGVCRYDGISLSWLYEDHLTTVPHGGSFGIRSILEDTKGKFWFCNTRYRYSISSDSITGNGKVLINYKTGKGIEGIKSTDGTDYIYFLSAIEDGHEDLWFVTYDQGVWRFDGKEVSHYPVRDGDNDITLYSIYKDRQGELWLGTHANGVFKYNGRTFKRFKP